MNTCSSPTFTNRSLLSDPLQSPEFGVDLQGFGQHLGTHVSCGVSTDVQFGQRCVAAQSVEDDGEVSLQPGVSQGQRGERLHEGERSDEQLSFI